MTPIAPATRALDGGVRVREIVRPYPARADQLPVHYAPGVTPNPEREREALERDERTRATHHGEARLRRHGNHDK